MNDCFTCKSHGLPATHVCLDKRCPSHLMCLQCAHPSCYWAKMSVDRLGDIVEDCEKTQQNLLDSWQLAKSQFADSKERIKNLFWGILDSCFDSLESEVQENSQCQVFSDALDRVHDAHGDFEMEPGCPTKKHALVQQLRTVTKLPASPVFNELYNSHKLKTKLEQIEKKIASYLSSLQKSVFGCKSWGSQKAQSSFLGALKNSYSISSTSTEPDQMNVTISSDAKVIDSGMNDTNNPFSADLTEQQKKLNSYAKELTASNELDQEMTKWLGHVESFNQKSENAVSRKIVGLDQNFVFLEETVENKEITNSFLKKF